MIEGPAKHHSIKNKGMQGQNETSSLDKNILFMTYI